MSFMAPRRVLASAEAESEAEDGYIMFYHVLDPCWGTVTVSSNYYMILIISDLWFSEWLTVGILIPVRGALHVF